MVESTKGTMTHRWLSHASSAAICVAAMASYSCIDELPLETFVTSDSLDISVFFDEDDYELMVGSETLIASAVTLGSDTLTGLYRARFESLDPTLLFVRSLADLPDSVRNAILGNTAKDSLDATIAAQVIGLSRGFGDFRITIDSIKGDQSIATDDFLQIIERWQSVSAGVGHTCAVTFANTFSSSDSLLLPVRPGGEPFCWGVGTFGALGTGSTNSVNNPEETSTDRRFSAVKAGAGYTCGADIDGLLYCWGDNTYGALGLGNRLDQYVPRLTALGESFLAFDVGTGSTSDNTTCAVKRIGSSESPNPDVTICWGSNSWGQLGCGPVSEGCPSSDSATFWVTQPNTALGIAVVDAEGATPLFSDITMGDTHACGLTLDGVAMCWGQNDHGELGVEITADLCGAVACSRVAVPVEDGPAVPSMLRFRSLSAGGHFTCGVTTTDEVYCWGTNDQGQLGSGAPNASSAPVFVVQSPAGVVSVGAGFMHACALAGDGAVFCWGNNADGQLGDGTTDPRDGPVLVTGDIPFAAITVGDNHACGIVDVPFDVESVFVPATFPPVSGRIWCWGYNLAGQLGDRTNELSPFPVQIAEPLDYF